MIIRIGWVTGSAYEWTQTGGWRSGRDPSRRNLAVHDWRNSAPLTTADKAILAATNECLAGKMVSAAAWARWPNTSSILASKSNS